MNTRAIRRSGFTLLEMILALAIGILLMGGLYFALDMHLAATSSGRVQIEQAAVARFVVKNLTNDVKSHLATLDAYQGPMKTSTSTSSTAAAATDTSTDTSSTMMATTGMFNLGVQGTSDQMSLYISKVPKAATLTPTNNAIPGTGPDMQVDESDQRRITYWLVPNMDGTGGLARQEVLFSTSDDELANIPPSVSDQDKMIFAPTVVAVMFEYFDGTAWQNSWDGRVLMADGMTQVGPPVAIAITVNVARPDNIRGINPEDPTVKKFRHVIQIPTASFHVSQTPTAGGIAP